MQNFKNIAIIFMILTGIMMMVSIFNQRGIFISDWLKEATIVVSEYAPTGFSSPITGIMEQKFVFSKPIYYGDTLDMDIDFCLYSMSKHNINASIKIYYPESDTGFVYEFMIEDNWIQGVSDDHYTSYITPVILPLQLPKSFDFIVENAKPLERTINSPLAIEIKKYTTGDSPVWGFKLLELSPCMDSYACDFEFSDGSKYKYKNTLIKCEH